MTIRYLPARKLSHTLSLLDSDIRTYRGNKVMLIELDEWEANYMLDYLNKEADYTMDREPKVLSLRDKVQTAFNESGFKRIDLIGD
jgi:hypothetical protein